MMETATCYPLAMTRLPAIATIGALLTACAGPPAPRVGLPLLQGWFDGEAVVYVTTDVSDAQVAQAKGANFAPRLADALPAAGAPPGQRSALEKVYAVTNFDQGSVFASAPNPLGPLNRDPAYSALWRMVTVTWGEGQAAHVLKSEEEVLDAAEKGRVTLQITGVVLNCPIVGRGSKSNLPGASM
jgi:hypothetical protein